MRITPFILLLLAPLAWAGNPQAEFEELVANGLGGVERGATPELGDYILSVSTLEIEPGTNLSTAIETVRILAQRELASVIGAKMSAKTVSETKSTTITVDDQTKTKIVEFFSDSVREDTNQYLRGATVFDSRITGNQIFVGFLLSKKFARDAAELASYASVGSGAASFDGRAPKRDLRVEALGLAEVRDGKLQVARENAMASARRNAVEHAMGVTVVATGQVRNLDPNSARFKNLSHSLGEVLRSKVLAEGQEGSFYKIKIAALVTAADFSKELGKYMAAIGNPLFYVDRSSGDELGDEFSIFFKDLGFKLTGNPREADYFIRLRSKFIDRKHPLRGTFGTQLQLTVEVIDPINEKVLLVQRNNPSASTNFLSDPDRRRQIVSERALLSMEKTLREKVSKMVADMVQNGREIEVCIRGGDKLGEPLLNHVSDQLEWIPGTSQAQGSSSFGAVTFSLRYLGSMDLLRSTLQVEVQKKFSPHKLSLRMQKSTRIEYLLH
jgi:hypothetical protein